MKNQVVKAMVEHTNENSMIKLWHQLATNSMLIVCIFELMRLVNLAIVQSLAMWKMNKHFQFPSCKINWNNGDKFKIGVNDQLQAFNLEFRVEECK